MVDLSGLTFSHAVNQGCSSLREPPTAIMRGTRHFHGYRVYRLLNCRAAQKQGCGRNFWVNSSRPPETYRDRTSPSLISGIIGARF
jgi:hypothetical protein